MTTLFSRAEAETFVPDGSEPARALARTTHLGVGAHQDDLELMAVHGMVGSGVVLGAD